MCVARCACVYEEAFTCVMCQAASRYAYRWYPISVRISGGHVQSLDSQTHTDIKCSSRVSRRYISHLTLHEAHDKRHMTWGTWLEAHDLRHMTLHEPHYIRMLLSRYLSCAVAREWQSQENDGTPNIDHTPDHVTCNLRFSMYFLTQETGETDNTPDWRETGRMTHQTGETKRKTLHYRQARQDRFVTLQEDKCHGRARQETHNSHCT